MAIQKKVMMPRQTLRNICIYTYENSGWFSLLGARDMSYWLSATLSKESRIRLRSCFRCRNLVCFIVDTVHPLNLYFPFSQTASQGEITRRNRDSAPNPGE